MIHDLIPELYYTPSIPWQARVLDNRRWAIANANLVVAVSESTLNDFRRLYPETAEKAIAIPHGPSLLDRNEPTPHHELADRVGIDPGQEYYLYVGQRHTYKNFELVYRLFSQGQWPPGRRLVCVGGPPPSPDETHPLISYITYVSDSDLAALYHNAKALIYPSLYEGFGLPILEAMSQDCPVVSSNAASLPEVGGDACLYFDPGSPSDLATALETIEDNIGETLVESGRQNLLRFSWRESTRRLIEAYKGIAQ